MASLDLLHEVAGAVREAGGLIRDAFRRPMDVRRKGRIDLVTDTDVAVERFLTRALADIVPEAAFLGEESQGEGGFAGTFGDAPLWIVDPLDGTTNFAHGLPFVATSVALWRGGRVELGVVNAPILEECYGAVRGGGAFQNGEPMRVSEAAGLTESLVATGFPYAIPDYMEPILANMGKVLAACQGLRRPGAAAIDLAYVAAGRYDGFYEQALKPWDTAAGWLLVEEAGGRVSRFDPDIAYTPGAPSILATNGRIHAALAGLLRE